MIELSLILFVILVLLGLTIAVLQLNTHSTAHTPRQTALPGTNFIPSQMYLDNVGGEGIALNESMKTLCFIQSATLPPKLLHYTNLLAVLLVKNQAILSDTLRTYPKDFSALALESKKDIQTSFENQPQTSPGESNQKIDLWVVMKEENTQTHTVNFLDMDTKEDGILFNKAMGTARYWYQLISDLVHQASGSEIVGVPHSHNSPAPNAGTSIAHELEKLSELRNNKIITQQDFDKAKEAILSRA
ncbi:MAG: SHOCT domain-containing protein [Nitrospirales bacterium]|nr:SHOCT domain-containing protein [Nitrospira sp.]MDR4501872.1 SHOCT domain-containing protein [Nitrospirales bacterium]